MDFDPRVLQEKLLSTMIRRAFGLGRSSPKYHDRSAEDACLLYYAQMSEQLRPRAVEESLIGPFYQADVDLLVAMQDQWTWQ